MRWLLLEKVHSIHKGKKAVASSKVPQAPYSSEVLFIEMMAQTGGLLVGAESDYQKDLIFAKIENATITTIPNPGTPLQIEAWSESLGTEGDGLRRRLHAPKDWSRAQSSCSWPSADSPRSRRSPSHSTNPS